MDLSYLKSEKQVGSFSSTWTLINNWACSDEAVSAFEMKQVPFDELCTLSNLLVIYLSKGEMCFVFLAENHV